MDLAKHGPSSVAGVVRAARVRNWLLAFDLDDTFLKRGSLDEQQHFQRLVAPQLLDALHNGAVLAAVTGNSESQVCDRFLRWFLPFLCRDAASLRLVERIHVAFQLGGGLGSFDLGHPPLATLVAKADSGRAIGQHELFNAVVKRGRRGSPSSLHSCFIDTSYTHDTAIPPDDARAIEGVLRRGRERFHEILRRNLKRWARRFRIQLDGVLLGERGGLHAEEGAVYDLGRDWPGGGPCAIERRTAVTGARGVQRRGVVQITIRPVLSVNHRREAALTGEAAPDPRRDLEAWLQGELCSEGLDRYAARVGGQGSVDVTKRSVDKATAIRYLLRKLDLLGDARRDEKLGHNLVWIGDEICPQGNDYSVLAGVPGATTIALNPPSREVPVGSGVVRPYGHLYGPEAAAEFLAELNGFLRERRRQFNDAEGASPLHQFLGAFIRVRILNGVAGLPLTHGYASRSLDVLRSLHLVLQEARAERPAALSDTRTERLRLVP